MEDVLETLLGLEIADEGDESVDMQKLARRLWRKRANSMGLDSLIKNNMEPSESPND